MIQQLMRLTGLSEKELMKQFENLGADQDVTVAHLVPMILMMLIFGAAFMGAWTTTMSICLAVTFMAGHNCYKQRGKPMNGRISIAWTWVLSMFIASAISAFKAFHLL